MNQKQNYLVKKNLYVRGSHIEKKLKPEFIKLAKRYSNKIKEYRGLDSDLWALYEEKYDKLNVAIHYIDEDLYTVDVLSESNCPINKIQELYQIKYYTTCLATMMVLNLLGKFRSEGKLKGVKQTKLGKYYSAMPIDKKWETQRKFDIVKGRHYNG